MPISRMRCRATPHLGELCVTLGDNQQSYIDSFSSFEIDFSYHCDDPTMPQSVDKLKAWFAEPMPSSMPC